MLLILATMANPAYSQSPDKLRDHLSSRIYYVAGKAIREQCLGTILPPNGVGGMLLAGTEVKVILHLSEVEAVEVIGDQITLPSPIVVQALLEGRLAGRLPPPWNFINPPVQAQVWFNNKTCVEMTFYPERPDWVKSGDAWISVPTVSENCAVTLSHIRPGMSRSSFAKWSYEDGGISVPFRQERYVLKDCPIKDRVVKLNVAFKRAGISDAIYFHSKWDPKNQSPDDTLMRISPPYVDLPFFD